MIRLALCAALLLGAPAAAQCRLALALALDISGSVDTGEYALQKSGLAAALLDERVQAALLATPDVHVRLMAFEWSGPSQQHILADWHEIRSEADLRRFAGRINMPGSRRFGPRSTALDTATALGAAMRFGLTALNRQQVTCGTLKLDVSGDGKSNTGPTPQSLKPLASAYGVTINALVIGTSNPASRDTRYVEIGELSAYFSANVITGPGAFVEVALGFEDYKDAMARKLLREIAPAVFGLGPPLLHKASASLPQKR